jgi:2-methylisocitrate lyase-like PEP mutase family enzyme
MSAATRAAGGPADPVSARQSPGARLRAHMAAGGLLVAPGAFDGLSARIVAEAGFEAVYASGGAIARSMGLPDLGLVGPDAVVARLADMVDAVSVPVIADADTGYGNALNVVRTVRAFERAGVAALHLEDQVTPKRCGHYDDKAIVPVAEMVGKLRAAVEARSDPGLVIIARTDARAVEGFEAAVERARAFVAAGADVVFLEAPQTIDEIAAVPNRVPAPCLLNMFQGGKTPYLPASRVAEMGYRIMIVPSDLQRAAVAAMQEAARQLREQGSTEDLAARGGMISFAERERVVDQAAWRQRERRYADKG